MACILVVDDEKSMRRILSSILQGEGHVVVEAPGAKKAAERAAAVA